MMRALVPFLLLPATLSAQSPSPGSWAGDVDVLLAAIDSIHPAPYRAHSAAEFRAAGDQLKRRLPSLTWAEAVAGLAGLMAMLEDGHSRMGHVRLSSHTQPTITPEDGPGFSTIYPIRLEFFADGLWVTGAAPMYATLLGTRVTGLAGRPARAAGDALMPFIARDNAVWPFYVLPQYLRHPGYLHSAGLIDSLTAPLVIETAAPDGSRRHATLRAVSANPAPALADARAGDAPVPLWRRFERNFGFRYLPDRRVMYVRYQEVQPEDDETVADFATRLFGAMDTVAVDRMILDVRRNGGGNNYLNQPLIHGILRRPELRDPGDLVILTDRGTFSAAISLISELERNTWAVFLGEPSGSPVNQYGDPARVTLPASGLLVRISTLYWQGSDPRDTRSAILPDSLIVPTFADWHAGRDPVLEAPLAFDASGVAWRPQPNMNWARPAQRREFVTGLGWGASR